MPILASVRQAFCGLICSLALLCAFGALAQDLPVTKITGDDVRQALIWTGHYSVMTHADPVTAFHDASRSWQKARGYPLTDALSDEQMTELLADAARQKDAFGWTNLEDKSVGFSIGVPTKLVKFAAARMSNGAMSYDFDGGITYTIRVSYGDLSCSRLKERYRSLLQSFRPFYTARWSGGFAIGVQIGSQINYAQALCRESGAVFAEIGIPQSMVAQQGLLFSAMAESLQVDRQFNPTAVPHPKIEQPTPIANDFHVTSAANETSDAKADGDGRTAAIQREVRSGSDLSVEQVFEKASAAVYMVKAGDRMGSAVAVSTHDLLTNCHVVKDKPSVTLVHGGKEQRADVVSTNDKADRCVLHTTDTLPAWVTVRPYDDIKVGERAITIGTPQGLELTVGEGIVSSKRSHEGSRLVQTTAPISQGSSGGGLFDAQGHLLAITTFYLKVGQNLNFAVAAEDFARSPDTKPVQTSAAP
ncbi:Trypsin-like peptidase domain-containing protein [Enhydrobacter aerosaccus]|uniref:Trypsin-like peptidase domain-containing protein n=1 Tax=Enhydrobacter aerosaccus TaxID=225324 RepID=A0A1T4N5A4_9HYPH|nr:serine protease [Enhydrobacter aerosaccus]SJZ74550.1 Trypsin-like peptidase domain-containing protein [Enhydrobacter aerosaccus]